MGPHVAAVARSGAHTFSKPTAGSIHLLAGLGVDGDAHLGQTVKHRSRVRIDPTRPNLRQVHLIHAELLDELAGKGFAIAPGELGENVTTRGLDLLALPAGTRLSLGRGAIVEITGLRNPCAQIEAFRPGLLAAVLTKRQDGHVVRKTGVMGIVLAGGDIRPGDEIGVELPAAPHRPLEVV
jgi:MOSC domain-containing protein YiiM